jgi:hypothetical protein
MMETSRELGHALGATAAATLLAMSIPAGVEMLPFEAARGFFMEGFRQSTLAVVWIMLLGALLVYFQKAPLVEERTVTAPASSDL